LGLIKITEQITIKLNKEKFEKVLDDLMSVSAEAKTRSELVAKSLWFLHCFTFKKIPKFGNKTHLEILIKEKGMTMEQFLIECQKSYKEFLQANKP
jgi:hypothetical protein